jgi:hypothetical protein
MVRWRTPALKIIRPTAAPAVLQQPPVGAPTAAATESAPAAPDSHGAAVPSRPKVEISGAGRADVPPTAPDDARAAKTLGFEVHAGAAQTANAEISAGRFDQSRSMVKISSVLPGLMKDWEGLPEGSVVLDLGSGKGFAIATAVAPERYEVGGNAFGETKEIWTRLATKVSHLRFVGITATSEQALVAPPKDPNHRYEMFAGTFFADVPTDQVVAAFGKKASSAYDVAGVFAYSSTPDKDLVKLHELTEPGTKTFIRWEKRTPGDTPANFQLPDGSVVDMAKYIETYFGEAFKVESVEEFPSDMLILTTKDAPAPRPPAVEMMHTQAHGTPPIRTFRVLDPSLTPQQRAANELKLWDSAAVPTRFSTLASGSIFPRGPWWVTDPAHPRNKVPASKEVAVAMLQEEIAATYASFSTETVQQKDPLWNQKILMMLVSTGDQAAAGAFFEAHRAELSARSPMGVAFTAVLDLAAGRSDTPAVQELAAHIPPAGVTLPQLRSQAVAQGSPVPVTLESLLADLRSGQGYSLEPANYPGAQPAQQWKSALKDKPAADKDTLTSTFDAVDALKMAVRTSPAAQEWMRAKLGQLSL